MPGAAHLSIRVDDVDSAWSNALELGAHPVGAQVTTITAGPNVGGKMAYLRAPGGVIVELFQPAQRPTE